MLSQDQLAVWKPLTPRDISELGVILSRLIQANQDHHQPGQRARKGIRPPHGTGH